MTPVVTHTSVPQTRIEQSQPAEHSDEREVARGRLPHRGEDRQPGEQHCEDGPVATHVDEEPVMVGRSRRVVASETGQKDGGPADGGTHRPVGVGDWRRLPRSSPGVRVASRPHTGEGVNRSHPVEPALRVGTR